MEDKPKRSYKNLIILLITTVVVVVLAHLLTSPNSYVANDEHVADMPMKHGHLNTYGPGEAPHLHNIDYSKLETISDIAKDPSNIPPPLNRNFPKTVKIFLEAKEVISDIAPNVSYHYWTFNETIPGPFLRVREGDTVELTLSSDKTNTHDHSIDLHAVTGPAGGAVLTKVKPGEDKTMRFKALNSGLFVYHCGAGEHGNIPMHMAHGMYGMILVEPKDPLPKVDKEYYVMQGELYTTGKIGDKGFQEFDASKMLYENPEYVVLNGRINALADHPLTANVGESVRIYFGDAGVSYASSFHIMGEIFDTLYEYGSTSSIKYNVQTALVPAGGAAIVDVALEVPGNYVLLDHSISRIDKGAWGVLQATGKENHQIYRGITK